MTHEDAGHYAAKHPKGAKVSEALLEAVKETASQGKISCAQAFKIVRTREVEPLEVGMAVDILEIKLEKCQLGLFGYGARKRIVEPAAQIDEPIRKAIEESLVNGRLSCAACWDIAARFGCPKMDVAALCQALSIKISPCQLGSF